MADLWDGLKTASAGAWGKGIEKKTSWWCHSIHMYVRLGMCGGPPQAEQVTRHGECCQPWTISPLNLKWLHKKFMPQSIKCIIIVIVIVVVVVDDDKPWTVYLILFSHLMFWFGEGHHSQMVQSAMWTSILVRRLATWLYECVWVDGAVGPNTVKGCGEQEMTLRKDIT